MQKVPREVALKDKAACALIPGAGYVLLGRPTVPPSSRAPCTPPKGTRPATLHALRSPGGNLVTMQWDGSLWEDPAHPGQGNRLAWTPEYLGASGWTCEASS